MSRRTKIVEIGETYTFATTEMSVVEKFFQRTQAVLATVWRNLIGK
jgi:hypothetical protein